MPSRPRLNPDGARPPLPRHTPIGALLPVLAVEEGCFVTTDGRYGRALACTGLNPRIQGAAAAELAAARFGAAVAVLPPDAHLQLVVINRPLRGEDWVPRHLAQYRPPAGPLADYARDLDAAYRRALAGTHVPELRFYAIVTVPGPPPPKGRAIASKSAKIPHWPSKTGRNSAQSPHFALLLHRLRTRSRRDVGGKAASVTLILGLWRAV